MCTLAPPVQSVASAVSGTDPISLVDGISSFLQTLKKFNVVVDQIAMVSITLCPASPSRMLTPCLDSSLRASSVDNPRCCFQGLAIALCWSHYLIYRLQAIVEQADLDSSVRALLSKMDEIYTFLTNEELKVIESMKSIVERITHQTVQCSYFIQAYCGDQKFRKLT